MKVQMKPETIARREAARTQDHIDRRIERIRRFRLLVEEHGADSVWADYLAAELASVA